MKYFISADIEGVSCICHRDETGHNPEQWKIFAEQMSREVGAASREILSYDSEAEITIRDAHYTGRNLQPSLLPKEVRLIREWSGDPLSMMDGIDSSYDACLFIGYHSEAGNPGNPLSHTMNSSLFTEIRINGSPASEARINAYTAANFGIPVIFISGDEALCDSMSRLIPGLHYAPVLIGKGAKVNSLHPEKAIDLICEQLALALRNKSVKPITLESHFIIDFEFLNHRQAFRNSFYPGAKLFNNRTVRFENNSWYEILRALHFMS